MDLSAIIVKIVGLVFLLWTIRSIFKHVQEKRAQAAESSGKTEKSASMTETLLNNALLYLWLAFMVVFSFGMIINN